MGDHSSKSFEKFCENISHIEIEAEFYATDKFPAHDTNHPKNKHLIGKSHIFTVERMNCWFKILIMIDNSGTLFLYHQFVAYIHFQHCLVY